MQVEVLADQQTEPVAMFNTGDRATATLVKTNASDLDVCAAAWVSNYGADTQGRREGLSDEEWEAKQDGLINFLYKNRHMSPFEHGSFTFLIDCPLFVAREFHRHRTWSYNEVSGRYKEMEGRFYVPSRGRPLTQIGKPGAYKFTPGTDEQYELMVSLFMNSFENDWKNYNIMLENGIAREVARDVLPLSLYTQFYATANPRNVMQFLQLRDDDAALYEIQAVARDIDVILWNTMPMTHRAFHKHDWRKT